MPRFIDWREWQDNTDLAPYRYTDLDSMGGVQIAESGDAPDALSLLVIPVGTVVFSLYLDGMAPWVTRSSFHNYNGMWPEEWAEPSSFDDDYPEDDGYTEDYGYIETDDDPTAVQSKMQIPALPDRPTRCMSMEIEVGRGGTYLAEQLHRAELSVTPYMGGYHGGDDGGFCRVEEDSSVGAEIIFSKMYLSRPGHAEKFEKGLTILRKAVRDGQSKLDMRCGLHIHVGLNRDRSAKTPAYTMDNIRSLYHLWNYLEDTIFRLGSANWSGHRSQHGNSYSPVTPKQGDTRNLRDFGRCALNISGYLNFLRYPEQDYGSIPTVEFRVFNTSTNQRKIRAYAALCQALVAMAAEHQFTATDNPVFGWTTSSEPDHTATKERLDFILNRLPLTNAERQDILYCAERSSLASCL